MADHDGNHRCLTEKNVPIALILSSRWHDGAESLGMETTSCVSFCGDKVSSIVATSASIISLRQTTEKLFYFKAKDLFRQEGIVSKV